MDVRERQVTKCTRHGVCGARTANGRANDRQQIGTKRGDGGRQCALFGSDQADRRVTRSNSLNSFATTWSASAFVDNAST